MKQVEIAVDVPLKAAVLNGQTRYGNTTLAPTEEQLQSLSAEELWILDRFLVRDGPNEQQHLRIRCAPASWEGVADALHHMAENQTEAQRRSEEKQALIRSRERSVPAVAAILRGLVPQAPDLSDQEFIEHAILALMEDVRDKIVEKGISANLIRIVSVDSPEWCMMSLSVREEYTLEAAGILRKVEESMKQVLPSCSDGLFRSEAMVVRVRQRAREDGILRRPVTHAVGVLHCAATASTEVLVRAEPLAVVVSG